MPAHPLAADSRPATPYSSSPLIPARKRKLKSAQKFSLWLSSIDIVTACVAIWEVTAVRVNPSGGASVARIFFTVCARTTLLLLVALLSFVNVVRGRPITTGKSDLIIWLPAFVMLGAGTAGAAVLGNNVKSGTVWQFLLGWNLAISFIVVVCFGRLLTAVIRVRQESRQRETPVMVGRVSFSRALETQLIACQSPGTTVVNSCLQCQPKLDYRLASSNKVDLAFITRHLKRNEYNQLSLMLHQYLLEICLAQIQDLRKTLHDLQTSLTPS